MSGGSATGNSPREHRMGPRGFPTPVPAPPLGPSGPIPRRGTLTRLGFLCTFPMIFLSLASNLWASGRTSSPLPPWEPMASLYLNLWGCILAGFLARLMSAHRPESGQAGYPRLHPVLLASPSP
jgi:hypothetical protein